MILAALVSALATSGQVLPEAPYAWSSVKLGGVEYATGYVWSARRPKDLYLRADGGGVWRLDRAKNRWVALMDDLPYRWRNLATAESLAVHPTDPKVMWVAAGSSRWSGLWDVLKTIDGGRHWTRTNLANARGEGVVMEGNGPDKQAGERLVADPNDPRVLFFGSRNDGLFRSDNGAGTWRPVTTFPNTGAQWNGITFVTFDPSSGRPCRTVYAGVHAGDDGKGGTAQGGVYRSDDGGVTWRLLAGGPTAAASPMRGRLGPDGTLWVSAVGSGAWDQNTRGAGGVWVYQPKSDAWIDVTPAQGRGGNYCGINPHPTDARRAVCSPTWGGNNLPVYLTTDAGASWKEYKTAPDNRSGTAIWSDAPAWDLHEGENSFPGNTADVLFDPLDPAFGWHASFGGPSRMEGLGGPKLTLRHVGDGREQMTTGDAVSPAAGAPFVSGVWDVGGFRHESLTRVPATTLVVRDPQGRPFAEGYRNSVQDVFDLDTSPKMPDVIVLAGGYQWNGVGLGAVSRDNGRTFRAFPAKPFPEASFGRVAVSATDPQNFLWAPMGAGRAVYATRDGGQTWTVCKGAPTGMINGDGPWTFFQPLAADRVTNGRFYVYDRRDGGFFRSNDGGATFARLATLPKQPGVHFDHHRLEAAPGLSGTLFLSLDGGGLYRSKDGGIKWSRVPGVGNAPSHAFGRPMPGSRFPALFLLGTVGTSGGDDARLYRSDNLGASWRPLGGRGQGLVGFSNLTGDMQVAGRVYVGTGGRGFFVGAPAGSLPTSRRLPRPSPR